MRCNCCDRKLEEKEIQWNPDIKTWEMCGVCLDIAYDAAFSQGFEDEDYEYAVEEDFDDNELYTADLSSIIGGSSYSDEGWGGD